MVGGALRARELMWEEPSIGAVWNLSAGLWEHCALSAYEGAELLQAPALKSLCCSHGCGCPAQLGIITIIVTITAFC